MSLPYFAKWSLSAKKPGQHKIHLTIVAIIDADGEKFRKSIKTYEKTIKINVSASQLVGGFISKNWQWLWAAILVPAGTLYYRRSAEKPINLKKIQI